MITQLAKMLFLATVFPVPLDEDDDDPNAEMPFDFLMVRNLFEFLFKNEKNFKFWGKQNHLVMHWSNLNTILNKKGNVSPVPKNPKTTYQGIGKN